MSLSIAVLITNYNTWPDAERCARSAVRYCGDALDTVLIVDDCSDVTGPGSLPEPIRVVRNETNQGYVRSVNIGFARLDSDIVVMLDSDAEPLVDFVPGVRNAFQSDETLGALAFRLVDRQGKPTGSTSPEPTVWRFVVGQKTGAWISRFLPDSSTDPNRMCIHSCGMAVRRAAFESVGGFDESFDFLDADTDFSMRLRKKGWTLQQSEDVVAYHEGGGSPQTTAKRVVRHHRNRWRLLEKHGKLSRPALTRSGLALRHIIEYGLLRFASSLVTSSSAEREDKTAGRRTLLRRVWNGYQAS